jgi:hypothetical protein
LNSASTNSAGLLHRHLNADVQMPHPEIYIFVRTLLRRKTETQVSVGSLAFTRAVPKAVTEKLANAMQLHTAELSVGENF